MQKLGDIIGRGKSGNHKRTSEYDIAYAWHKNNNVGVDSFQLSLSDTCLLALKFSEGDRCDIFVDLDARTGMVALSKTGEYGLSKNASRQIVKIAAVDPCLALAQIFPKVGGQTSLERVAIHTRSITFKLP
jgi:hypothetical protein